MDTDTGTQTDSRTLFASAVDLAGEVLAAVTPDQLGAPTPCTEFDVDDLIGHMVMVLDRVAALGHGGDPMAVVAPGDASGAGWPQVFSDAAAGARAAWSDGTAMAREIELPWARGTGAEVLVGYVSEITVHTWDLATATGQRPEFAPEVVAASIEVMRDLLPPDDRSEYIPFADVVAVAEDATAIERLVAFTGRRP